MRRPRCFRIFLFCNFMWASVLGEECPFKECSCTFTLILCDNIGLVTMPQRTVKSNTYFTKALYDGNQITAVTAGTVPANLTAISFKENPTTTIDDDAFDESADSLTVLSLSYARFTRIPDALLHLNSLTDLTITNTNIQDWNLNAMKHIGSTLKFLTIGDIVITTWPSWLQYFSNLTMLSMTRCSLTDIPDNAVDALASTLSSLILSFNNLIKVPKAFSKLSALGFLSLDNNKIFDIQWLPESSKLGSLFLNNNKLNDSNQLSSILRSFASSLYDFKLQNNLLTVIPTFDYLTRVLTLDLTNNQLMDPNSGSVPPGLREIKMKQNSLPRIPRILSRLRSVKILFLASNEITELEGVAFPPLVTGVELDHNRIMEIKDTSFPVNSTITYIFLNNNPLVKVSNNAFKNVPRLVELIIKNTKFTRLPLALASLVKVDIFDISGTDSLVCTCLEKSLQDWVLSMPASQIKGSCGRTSIYDFYSLLSSECP